MLNSQDFLFRCNPDPMWIYDRETLEFIAVNEAAVQRYGFSEAEFLAMTIAEIRPPEDHIRLRAAVATSVEGPNRSDRWRHMTRSGDVLAVEMRSFGLTYAGRPAEIVAVRDVTKFARLEVGEAQARHGEKAALDLLATAGRIARFGGWRLDLPSGALTWSDEMAAIHGESPGQQITLDRSVAYYVPEHRNSIRTMLERSARDGEPFDEVFQIVTADQRRLWVRTTGAAERDADGRIVGLRGAFQDIDELVRTRLRSEAVERRLTDTLNASGEGFLVLDDDWRFVFVNHAAERMLRRAPNSLEGKQLWEEFPLAVGGQFDIKYREAIAEGHGVAFEEFYQDLGWFDVRAYPSAAGLAVHFQNITDRKQTQADLQTSEERFRLVASVTNDVIWDLDFATDRMWWNEPMAVRFGHDVEIAARHPDVWTRNIHPEDRPRVRETMETAIQNGADGWNSAYRFIKGDGGIAHVMDRAVIVREPDGRPKRMLGSMADVSERLEIETRVLESQKIEALGRLTGGIAHDFNNLLTVIMGNSETLMEKATDAESRELARLNVTAAAQGADLIGRLLAFARRQPLKPLAVDVGELLAGLDPLLRRSVNTNIALVIEADPGLRPVLADPSQLESALLNLVINARDAMPGGGRVTIRAAAACGSHAAAPKAPAGGWLDLSVSDTGEGMTTEVQRRAFDPFFTTKEVGKGTGLGLSMVYGFAAQSEGSIHLESRLGAGTTVRLLLPYACEPAVSNSKPANPEITTLSSERERILIVEDDPLIRDHVARQLMGAGYHITLAADGPEALARLDAEPEFDLLFTDIVMPGGMDGRALARKARESQPNLRVLFTSGFIGALDEPLIPTSRWLGKPYRRQQLMTKIREILDDTPE